MKIIPVFILCFFRIFAFPIPRSTTYLPDISGASFTSPHQIIFNRIPSTHYPYSTSRFATTPQPSQMEYPLTTKTIPPPPAPSQTKTSYSLDKTSCQSATIKVRSSKALGTASRASITQEMSILSYRQLVATHPTNSVHQTVKIPSSPAMESKQNPSVINILPAKIYGTEEIHPPVMTLHPEPSTTLPSVATPSNTPMPANDVTTLLMSSQDLLTLTSRYVNPSTTPVNHRISHDIDVAVAKECALTNSHWQKMTKSPRKWLSKAWPSGRHVSSTPTLPTKSETSTIQSTYRYKTSCSLGSQHHSKLSQISFNKLKATAQTKMKNNYVCVFQLTSTAAQKVSDAPRTYVSQLLHFAPPKKKNLLPRAHSSSTQFHQTTMSTSVMTSRKLEDCTTCSTAKFPSTSIQTTEILTSSISTTCVTSTSTNTPTTSSSTSTKSTIPTTMSTTSTKSTIPTTTSTTPIKTTTPTRTYTTSFTTTPTTTYATSSNTTTPTTMYTTSSNTITPTTTYTQVSNTTTPTTTYATSSKTTTPTTTYATSSKTTTPTTTCATSSNTTTPTTTYATSSNTTAPTSTYITISNITTPTTTYTTISNTTTPTTTYTTISNTTTPTTTYTTPSNTTTPTTTYTASSNTTTPATTCKLLSTTMSEKGTTTTSEMNSTATPGMSSTTTSGTLCKTASESSTTTETHPPTTEVLEIEYSLKPGRSSCCPRIRLPLTPASETTFPKKVQHKRLKCPASSPMRKTQQTTYKTKILGTAIDDFNEMTLTSSKSSPNQLYEFNDAYKVYCKDDAYDFVLLDVDEETENGIEEYEGRDNEETTRNKESYAISIWPVSIPTAPALITWSGGEENKVDRVPYFDETPIIPIVIQRCQFAPNPPLPSTAFSAIHGVTTVNPSVTHPTVSVSFHKEFKVYRPITRTPDPQELNVVTPAHSETEKDGGDKRKKMEWLPCIKNGSSVLFYAQNGPVANTAVSVSTTGGRLGNTRQTLLPKTHPSKVLSVSRLVTTFIPISLPFMTKYVTTIETKPIILPSKVPQQLLSSQLTQKAVMQATQSIHPPTPKLTSSNVRLQSVKQQSISYPTSAPLAKNALAQKVQHVPFLNIASSSNTALNSQPSTAPPFNSVPTSSPREPININVSTQRWGTKRLLSPTARREFKRENLPFS